jgi:hypothetical protein
MKERKKVERPMDEADEHHGGWEPKSAAEIREMLDAVGKTIPDLLKSITENLYGPDAAKKYAEAVAEFYKALRAAGMSDEQAFQMTQEYMRRMSFGGMLGDLGIGRHFEGGGGKRAVKNTIDRDEKREEGKDA